MSAEHGSGHADLKLDIASHPPWVKVSAVEARLPLGKGYKWHLCPRETLERKLSHVYYCWQYTVDMRRTRGKLNPVNFLYIIQDPMRHIWQ